VQFTAGGKAIAGCSAQPVNGATGKATCTTTFAQPGTPQVQAIYSGDSAYDQSQSADLAQVVDAPSGEAHAATVLTSSADPTVSGAAPVYTATVSPAPGGGTVAFRIDGRLIAGCSAVAVGRATAVAVCRAGPRLLPGRHTVTAAYSGDGQFAASTASPLVERVYSSVTVRGRPRFEGVKLKVTLACAAGSGGCQIAALLASGHKRLGTARATVRAGKRGTVTLRLGSAARRQMAHGHKMTATLTISLILGKESSAIITRKLTLT
jgi:hypothetical protein